MALYQLYDKDNSHADPQKEARGCYKRGDIVEIMDDSKHDGDLVKNPIMPPWILIRVTDKQKSEHEHHMKPYIDPATVGTQHPVTLRRRQYNVEVDTFPPGILKKIQEDRYVELTWGQLRAFVRNRMTGQTE